MTASGVGHHRGGEEEENTTSHKSTHEGWPQEKVARCHKSSKGGGDGCAQGAGGGGRAAAHDPPNEGVICGADVQEEKSQGEGVGVTVGGKLFDDKVREVGARGVYAIGGAGVYSEAWLRRA
eukprot:6456173-Amphidinium_carterae.2